MRRLLSVLIVAVLICAVLVGCGEPKALGCEGKYIAMCAQTMGVTLTGEDVAGFDIVLEAGGKGSIVIDGDSDSMKWKLDGSTVTITVGSDQIVGTLSENTITVDNILDSEMTMIFALEGSPQADPALYIPETDKALMGEWYGYAVADVLGEDMSEDIDPEQFALLLDTDYTGVLFLGDGHSDAVKWSSLDNWGYFEEPFVDSDGAEIDISFELNDDGELEVTYDDEDYYLIFTCVKG